MLRILKAIYKSLKDFILLFKVETKKEPIRYSTYPKNTLDTKKVINKINAQSKKKPESTTKVDSISKVSTDDKNDFETSMIAGAFTGSPLLGYAIGGNIVGAAIGSSLTNIDDEPKTKSFDMDTYFDNKSSSSSSSSSDDYDYSCDSSSSDD